MKILIALVFSTAVLSTAAAFWQTDAHITNFWPRRHKRQQPEVDAASAAAVSDEYVDYDEEEAAAGEEVGGRPRDAIKARLDSSGLAVIDLHNEEFCVDVSTYGPVKFESTPREKCDTTFAKRCETKDKQVCDDVTEIQCDIVPFTECRMEMEATPYNSYEMVSKTYLRKECTEGMDTVQHTKMMPECRNVTKQNCITKWEEDADGNQVWAGNEACEPVTWRECKLVPRKVDFKVPKVDCVEGEAIPYTDCVEAEKTQMTTKMTCEVKHTTDCRPVTSTKCQNIRYQECQEEPVEACTTQEMMVPSQEKEHKKKCLLPDDGTIGRRPEAPRSARQLISARGANGKLKLPKQLNEQQQQQQQRHLLALERLSVASSERHTRAFQGQQHPRVVGLGKRFPSGTRRHHGNKDNPFTRAN